MPPVLKRLTSLAPPLTTKAIIDELRLVNSGDYKPWKLEHTTNNEDKPTSFLSAHYQLSSFAKTWLFLSEVAREANKTKHHPTIITTYNKVDFKLTTHDAGNQVTNKDITLAYAIRDIFLQVQVLPGKSKSFESFLKGISERSMLSEASKTIENLMSAKDSKQNKS
ncbi:transcriptional coactivator/pterin dehydratase [Yamadazyma tenuis ATCC 10573]|uniref:4a-hydroxytetrahydrobiopterin dehydratase n=1 Tax=Candida tenuis (strain ATCC 10573 / BCRC 21748 / CBS 615 / JCM 9827 / NBRC 10315 / NRRL Y-1498 / VKM Y-70) TaxID=590646 RepID=G3AZ40_CANTC|nr:transcriptional coactivator/pterin dehydratase [Yamadazyma tenuis ATCC 10573]EGV66002.1 transcriptional coactivator/pterin dehydratase [Yamadazyma tenuis ATCC 10573]